MKSLFLSLFFLYLIIEFNSCAIAKQKKQSPYSPQNTSASTTTFVKNTYDRKDWPHWIDENGDCQNTRAEILISRSQIKPTLRPKGCSVSTGIWQDYYFNEIHQLASAVDIDHLIPLKHAYDMGGSSWDKETKKKFANDPENLVITNKKYNRQKGAQSITTWLPIEKKYACKYIRDWIKIKTKYELIYSNEKLSSIKQIEPTCQKLGIEF